MQIFWKPFGELTTHELYAILSLRQNVFMVEQQSLYNDIDGADQYAQHLLAFKNDTQNQLIGYLRLIPNNHQIKIGRVVVSKIMRGQGVGKQLMTMAIEKIKYENPNTPIVLSAQVTSQQWYEQLGFCVSSEPYDDAGVLHVNMTMENLNL